MGKLSKDTFAGVTYAVMGMGTEGGRTPYQVTVAANGGWNGTPIATRYMEAPHQLTAGDWKSGDQIWIIDLVTPFGGAPKVIKELRETVFAGKPVNQLMPSMDGQAKAMTWPAMQGAS